MLLAKVHTNDSNLELASLPVPGELDPGRKSNSHSESNYIELGGPQLDDHTQALKGELANQKLSFGIADAGSNVRTGLAAETLRARSVSYASEEIELARERGILTNNPEPISRPVDLSKLEVSAFTMQGLKHLVEGQPCQDCCVVLTEPKHAIALVCDGAGSVPLAQYSAEFYARLGIQVVRARLQELEAQGSGQTLVDPEFLGNIYADLYQATIELIDRVGVSAQIAYAAFLPSTIQILIATPKETLILALGDGYVSIGNSHHSITERVGRVIPPEYNCPPFLATAIAFDTNADFLRSGMSEGLRYAFHEEAKAFAIVAHGSTAEMLKDPLSLSTDGLRFSQEVLVQDPEMSRIPALELIKDRGVAAATELIHMVNLYLLLQDPFAQSTAQELLVALLSRDQDSVSKPRAELEGHIYLALREYFGRDFAAWPELRTKTPLEGLNMLISASDNPYDREAFFGLRYVRDRIADPLAMTIRRNIGVHPDQIQTPLYDDISIVSFSLGAQTFQSASSARRAR